MSYEVKSPRVLFSSCMESPLNEHDRSLAAARAWVEAENTYAVFQLIIEWFKLMESGETQHRYPAPGDSSATQEQADLLIAELDADFIIERNRWPVDAQGRRWGPEFSRLPPHSRLAFAQEVQRLLQTEAQIWQEARERLAKGETLPPKPVS